MSRNEPSMLHVRLLVAEKLHLSWAELAAMPDWLVRLAAKVLRG